MIPENFSMPQLLAIWLILILWSIFLGLYRTLVDRIRSGLIASPSNGKKSLAYSKIVSSCLITKDLFIFNTSSLSSLQVFFWFLVFYEFLTKYLHLEGNLWVYLACFLCAIAVERISSWMFPKKFRQAQKIEFYLRIGLLPVVTIRLICKPLTLVMVLMEKRTAISKSKRSSANKKKRAR